MKKKFLSLLIYVAVFSDTLAQACTMPSLEIVIMDYKIDSKAYWPETYVERTLIGKWVQINNQSTIRIDTSGFVYRNGGMAGRTIMPCCGNFAYRDLLPGHVGYSNCQYRVYFSKSKDRSFWKLEDLSNHDFCPHGTFRREE